jgi:hypothetical protein
MVGNTNLRQTGNDDDCVGIAGERAVVVLFAFQAFQLGLEGPEIVESLVGDSGGKAGGADKGQEVALREVAPTDALNVVAGTDDLKGAGLGIKADIGGGVVKEESAGRCHELGIRTTGRRDWEATRLIGFRRADGRKAVDGGDRCVNGTKGGGRREIIT